MSALGVEFDMESMKEVYDEFGMDMFCPCGGNMVIVNVSESRIETACDRCGFIAEYRFF